MEIYLIRHTKTTAPDGVCYGQSDLDVDASFQVDMLSLKTKIPGRFDIVFSSPLKRCAKLARTLSSKDIIFDDRIREMNFGDWEMKYWNELPEKELADWMNDFVHVAPPNGESFEQIFQRVKTFWSEKIVNLKADNVAIVTHAGVIRSILADILGLELTKSFQLSIDYGRVSLVTFEKDVPPMVKYVNK